MSKIIQHKRSSIAGNVPDNTQIAVGELAINFPDRVLYTQTPDGEIIPLCCDNESPLEGGTELASPTNTQPAGPVEWKGSGGRMLTATYPLVISTDGYNFTDRIETTDNDTEIWTKWAGEPGSGDGIDGAHGTTITGAVTDDVGGAQSFQFTIDKETSFVFHNFVDSDQTVGGVSESRVVTAHTVNSYVYPSGTTTGSSPEYAKNGGSFTAMPATNTGSATDYLIDGDDFQLRHEDAATNNTASTYTFNTAGDTADWTTVTADVVPVILQPKIESPATDGELNISKSGPFVSSDFEMAEGTDTHTASSWKITKDIWKYHPSLDDIMYEGGWYGIWSVAWSPELSLFCAVGGEEFASEGKCVTSPDGVTWTEQPSFETHWDASGNSLDNDITWSETQFCVVGNDGKCATSPDGVTWTNQPGLATAVSNTSIYSVVWSGTQFCAVGDDRACATSPDGVTWTNQPGLATASEMGSMHSVAWSPELSLFCAVGADGAYCSTSPDGVTWTKQLDFVRSHQLTIVWTGTQFCSVGNKGCNTSPDGVTWTSQPDFERVVSSFGARGGRIGSVAWDGSRFCAVGEDGISVTSPDGVTWGLQLSLRELGRGDPWLQHITSNGTKFLALGEISATFEDEISASLDSDTSALTSWEPDGLDGDEDYAVRVKHHTATLNSEWSEKRSFKTAFPPGMQWTNQPGFGSALGSTLTLDGLVWSGTQFCAVGGGARCATSPDGVTWTDQPGLESAMNEVSASMTALAWSGTQFCALGLANKGLCATSPDGVTWTKQLSEVINISNGGDYNEMTWGGNQFCAVGLYARCMTSPDGVTWTRQPGLASIYSSAPTMYSIIWSGTQFCAVGVGAACATSPDGITWTRQPGLATATSSAKMLSVVWSGTQFCVVGDKGVCATSPDGVTWTHQPSLATEQSENMFSVLWSGSNFCAVGKSGTCATSPDGVTWTKQPSLLLALGSSYKYLKAIAWDGNQICGVGKNASCATSP